MGPWFDNICICWVWGLNVQATLRYTLSKIKGKTEEENALWKCLGFYEDRSFRTLGMWHNSSHNADFKQHDEGNAENKKHQGTLMGSNLPVSGHAWL